jgi:hypothetical protein
MTKYQDPSGQIRYAKRWKRQVGYLLCLILPLYLLTKPEPEIWFPLSDNNWPRLCAWLALIGWGIYWVARNPKSKERK